MAMLGTILSATFAIRWIPPMITIPTRKVISRPYTHPFPTRNGTVSCSASID